MADLPPPPRLLVVDDDEGLRLLISGSLRAEGYTVETADSGQAALAILAAAKVDLMLLDLKMKEVGGAALLKKLKRGEASVPFIVITGQGDEKVAAEVMKQGALDYLMKDSGLLDLLPSVVKRALEAVHRDRALAGAQERVRESELRLAAALRATNDGVWEWRIQSNRIYFSPRWKAMLGYEPEEISDAYSEWQSRVHPGDRDRLLRSQGEFFAGRGVSFNIEYRLRHKDGNFRWILLRGFLERDGAGQPMRLTGADADITEQKQMQKEILRISDREQWRIGQELHDGLGQQLTAIELLCESLRIDLTHDPRLAAQATRMGEFLRQAIAQTRALSHGLTPFMLAADGLQSAVDEMVRQVNSLGRAKCRLVCIEEINLKDSEASGHLFRIAQEATNNALKHSGATEIVVGLASRDGAVELNISDNGKGLPKANRRRDGMGLQVMQHRANAIGAELKIDSVNGKGVSVICVLRRTP